MKHRLTRIAFAALAAALVATTPAAARRGLRTDLAPTGADADAAGRAKLSLRNASDGKFEITVRHLDREATFDVIVNGVRVGSLVTKSGGSGKLRFRSRPRNDRDLPLGFDPRGVVIVVRDAAGDDVLAAPFPDDAAEHAGDVVCCIPDDSGTECEDRTADECAAEGGVVLDSATSCLPNPCAGAKPVADDEDIVCCLPDDSGPECEDRTQAECTAAGGTVVTATSCTPNPCAPIPPANPDVICCLPDNGGDGENECEDLTADACTAAGGTVSDATSCMPDPCNATPPPDDEIACCVPKDGAAECETRTPDECTARGGTPAPTSTCVPDPCGGSGGGGSGPH